MTELRNDSLNCLASYVPDLQEDIPTTKLLHALVEFAPTERGRANICHEILSARSATGEVDSAMLKELAERYFTSFLFPMATQVPKEPEMPEDTSIYLNAEINKTVLEEAKHDPCKMKYLALRRDGFRSLMTGKLELEAIERSLVEDDPSVNLAYTQAAHILPFALGCANNQAVEVNKPDFWELTRHFCGEDMRNELAGPNINRFENILTLSKDEHLCFGELGVWFEATAEPHVYVVRGRIPLRGVYTKDKVVRFVTTNDLIPLPGPRYLALHAACAQVVHACGIGAYIGRIMTDMEELRVLPEDGFSNVLVFALHRVSATARITGPNQS